MNLRVLRRMVEIERVIVRHRLDELVRATHLYRPLRLLLLVSPWTWFERRQRGTRALQLRLALQELGPIFVKFGQALSTRRDLLPMDIADELAQLQDRVAPFPGALARAAVETSFGKPVAEIFARFDDEPLAAASIAQVHVAAMKDGREVVVKILRPGMRGAIAQDLEVLYTLAQYAERWWPEARRLRPIEIVREYEKTVLDELDLLREAANASQLKRNFVGSPLLYVPEVYWDYCHRDVMVLERIHGVPIGEIEQLRAAGTDFKVLAENGVRIFFTQVFRHNFFHADMHPGNIFVIIDNPSLPRYAAVDFGIVGTLDPRDQRYLAENFLAVFERNYRRIAELHVESGWVPRDTRVDEMESAIRTICEPIFDRPLKEISFGTVLLRLLEALRRFDGQVQPQLILLQKTLFNVEGLGRQLYPELDIWKTASPVLREWMKERVSPRTLLRDFRRRLPDMVEVVKGLPSLAKLAMERAQDRTRGPGFNTQEDNSVALAALALRIERGNRRQQRLLVGGAVLVAGTLWYALSAPWPWLGLAGMGAGAVSLLLASFDSDV